MSSEQAWQRKLKERRKAEEAAGAKMFMGLPERWIDAGLWRCARGHVSTFFIKTEDRGDMCPAAKCHANVMLTFPEDEDGVLL